MWTTRTLYGKADHIRTLELLSEENIFVCLFCLPWPPPPPLLLSDSTVLRLLSWPRKCHLSTDQTCCTYNVQKRGAFTSFLSFLVKVSDHEVTSLPPRRVTAARGAVGRTSFVPDGRIFLQNLVQSGPQPPTPCRKITTLSYLPLRGGCSQKMTPW